MDMFPSGGKLESRSTTPLGCQMVFLLCAATYVLSVFDHHLFVEMDLTCRPMDVVYSLQLQRLFLASFVHTSLSGLVVAILLCWKRFVWIENAAGTVGFLAWFLCCSVLLHSVYCCGAVFLSSLLGSWLLSDVHGLFPLLTAHLVVTSNRDREETVWLWPFPIHVPAWTFPWVVIGVAWLAHSEAHLDVVAAYILATFCPSWVQEPSLSWLAQVENSTPGLLLLERVKMLDAFVPRPTLPGIIPGDNRRADGSLGYVPSGLEGDMWKSSITFSAQQKPSSVQQPPGPAVTPPSQRHGYLPTPVGASDADEASKPTLSEPTDSFAPSFATATADPFASHFSGSAPRSATGAPPVDPFSPHFVAAAPVPAAPLVPAAATLTAAAAPTVTASPVPLDSPEVQRHRGDSEHFSIAETSVEADACETPGPAESGPDELEKQFEQAWH